MILSVVMVTVGNILKKYLRVKSENPIIAKPKIIPKSLFGLSGLSI
jgi:hypothetical protein